MLHSVKSRRDFLSNSLSGLSSAWLAAHWPAMLSAAAHAQQAAKSTVPQKFDFFTPEQATEIDAVTSRIIPTTDTPGAHEAGVVYFIDRALVTFAKDQQDVCINGLADLQAHVAETFPGYTKFSALTPDRQDQILQSLDEHTSAPGRGRRRAVAASFFETMRFATISGFLIDPDSGRLGNRDAVGWKVIGRDPAHMFQPPFGHYDKDYPGFQLAPASEKGKS